MSHIAGIPLSNRESVILHLAATERLIKLYEDKAHLDDTLLLTEEDVAMITIALERYHSALKRSILAANPPNLGAERSAAQSRPSDEAARGESEVERGEDLSTNLAGFPSDCGCGCGHCQGRSKLYGLNHERADLAKINECWDCNIHYRDRK